MGDVVALRPKAVKRRPRPWTAAHYREYCKRLVFDDGEHHDLDAWQTDFAGDVFRGSVFGTGDFVREAWLIVPEGNGKTTMFASLALYGADFTLNPWIPVGASARDQAEIMYRQAKTFVDNTPGLKGAFRCHDGYRKIRSLRNGGEGIVICAWDPDSNDGAIPFPYALVDELHRHDDLRLYRLWKGKLRKRGGQILVISTAGEPGTEFEDTRDKLRAGCEVRKRSGARLRARSHGILFHEFMVRDVNKVSDMKAVKAANPLSTVTPDTLAEDFDSLTVDLGEWKRLKCNVPARSSFAAVSDEEWDGADIGGEHLPPKGTHICVGHDVAWRLDTTAIVPAWRAVGDIVLGAPVRELDGKLVAGVLMPPRDGSSLHPDRIKAAFELLNARNPIDAVAMDVNYAQDIAAWLSDELGVIVIEHDQGTDQKVTDYNEFMKNLRGGTLKHTGDKTLRRQTMNAIARRLPGNRIRFDRPSKSRSKAKQDTRVIDALDAAAMVNTHLSAAEPDTVVPMVGMV